NVKRMIEKLALSREWVDAGQGLRLRQRGDHARGGGAGASVSLEAAADRQRQAHDREARLVARMGRRRPGLRVNDDGGPPQLAFAEIGEATEEATEIYEYSVLVTSLDEDVEAFGQLYRDRGDGENIFDEMKNQWGWGGYTTHDLARCRLAARLLALFYNWWNIFVRLADPSLHREAI